MKAFEEALFGDTQVKNRIGIPAMCTYMVKTKDGVGDIHHIAHYETLAKGRPGFIVQEATAVNANGHISNTCLGIYTPRQRQVLKDIVRCVHDYNVKIGIQLNHAGIKNRFGNQKYGPMDGADVIAMDEKMIQDTIINFEFAARWARELGYDFIEVHAAHGYLINQFLSPLTNHRSDAYGQERPRLMREIIRACKENFEGDVIVRISAEEYEAAGLHISDMQAIVPIIEEAGASAISVSSGGLNKTAIPTFPMYQIPYATQIRSWSKLPVMGVGLITTEEEVNALCASSACDFILMGRALLRDPYTLLKWQDRQGTLRPEDIGECLYSSIHVEK